MSPPQPELNPQSDLCLPSSQVMHLQLVLVIQDLGRVSERSKL